MLRYIYNCRAYKCTFQSLALVFLILVPNYALTAVPESSSPILVTLEDVVKKVGGENYENRIAAKRLLQAKLRTEVARKTLMPKLNLWRLASIPFDPTSLIGLVGDIAPFLDPTKWFRLEEAKLLHLAQSEGFRVIWANALFAAKSLYVHLLLDRSLLEHVQESKRELKKLKTIIGNRELLGGEPKEASIDIEIRLLALQEDERKLEVLIAEEASQLAYMMGYKSEVQVVPASMEMPNFEELEPLDYADFEFRAVDSSPELRQMDHFISTTDWIEKEIKYSFLGTSDNSRGILGGVFDHIPIIDGLSFGTSSSLEFLSTEKDVLQLQREAVEETLKRHLRLLVSNYNLDLKDFADLKRGVELTKSTKTQLYERLMLGQNVESIKLIEASRNHIQADTSFFAVQYRFLTNEDKLARLIFHGDYSKEPAVIQALKKR